MMCNENQRKRLFATFINQFVFHSHSTLTHIDADERDQIPYFRVIACPSIEVDSNIPAKGVRVTCSRKR
jgi:hypothetical protein